MRYKMIIISTLLLSGCASVSKTYGPDGREAYDITCSGMARDWGMCQSKAGDICGSKGYNIISINGDSSFMVTANPQGAFGGSVISRNMLISCK
ncbi:hypothetical protein [Dickeya chrysanthemi]|uniref:hypothetical protein n=1 Tax=Dickeya chrysanthemi TaxID=556 RepID=UPI0008FC198F|nr:hypothetical protein [Dickeya chrysanthemi]